MRQILVDECDCHASLTDGRRNPLDWAQPHVAAGENTGRACFKKIGIAAVRPAPGLLHIVTRQNVSACVARHVRGQPFRLRVGTNEDEQAAAIMPTDLVACLVANVDRRKVSVAVDRMNFRPQLDRYIRFYRGAVRSNSETCCLPATRPRTTRVTLRAWLAKCRAA